MQGNTVQKETAPRERNSFCLETLLVWPQQAPSTLPSPAI